MAGTPAGTNPDPGFEIQAFELTFDLLRGTNGHRVDLVSGLGAGLRRGAAGHHQHPDALNRAITRLRNRGCFPAGSRPSCRLGVHTVRLAAPLAAQLPVGPHHLHHLDTDCGQITSQAGTVAAGPFHPDPNQPTLRSEPGDHTPIPGSIRRERLRPQQTTYAIHHRPNMDVPMGIYPTKNINPTIRHDPPPRGLPFLLKGVLAKNGGQYTHGASKLKLLQGHIRFKPQPRPRTGGTGRQIPTKAINIRQISVWVRPAPR